MKAVKLIIVYRAKGVFYLLFFVLFLIPTIAKSQFDISEIICKTDTISDLQSKTSHLLFLAEYFMQDQPDTAIYYAHEALDIAIVLHDSSNISDAYKCLSVSHAGNMDCIKSDSCFTTGIRYTIDAKDSASYYSNMVAIYIICGNMQSANNCYLIAKEIYTRIYDRNNLARLITNIGVMHTHNSNYYQASQSYLEALEIFNEMNDEESIAVIYQNMGEVMAFQDQYDKAVGYYNSALTLFEKLKRERQMAAVYLNLGQIYIEQSQWDVAKFYLNKSYIIDTTYSLMDYESMALSSLGVTYLRTGKFESAELLISEALNIQKESGYVTLVGETSTMLAEVYYKQQRYPLALKLIVDIEKQGIILTDEKLKARVLLLKSDILFQLDQYEKAFVALKESNKLSDSVFNIDKSKSIMNLELAYQSERKEKQIDELKYNDLINQNQLEKRMAQIYLLIVSVILLIVILVAMYIYWHRRRQNENRIREQRFLQGRFEAEEKAKDEIARELHDDIGGQLIGISLQLESSKKLNQSELNQIQRVYGDVRRLSHSLDEPLFNEVTLQEKIRNYLSELKNNVGFKVQFLDDITFSWDGVTGRQELQRNLYRIVQELITNTLKHANASEVDIQLLNDKQKLVLIYEDNGKGISDEELEKNLSFNTIRKRVEMYSGKLEITSQPNHGVFIMISIPVYTKNRK